MMNALEVASEDAIRVVARRERQQFIRGRSPAGWGSSTIGGARGSHAIANDVARSGDVAFRAGVVVAMELVMAHAVAVETGGPVANVRVRKGFIVLDQGEVGGVREAGVIRNMERSREHGAFIPQVVKEGIYLGHCSSKTELGTSS